MKTICEVNQCTGCMACVNACRLDAVSLIKTINKVKVIIDEEKCVHCGACLKVCPTHNSVEKHTSIMWKQGWAEDQYRKQGSSGGVASAVIAAFIKKGGYVCSCLFDKGEFTFICTNNLEKAKRFAGSKYVKSTPGYIYREVDKLLKNGEKVLFVGLPCQVAAAKNFISQNHQENLYTIDLICHGTPNDVVLDIYLKQHGVSKKNISDIKFRNIVGMGLTIDGNSVSVKGTVDRYLLSFMNALI